MRGKKRKKELLWTQIYNEAIKGNVKAACLIADRLEGRPFQQLAIDYTTGGEKLPPGQTVNVIDFSKMSKEQIAQWLVEHATANT